MKQCNRCLKTKILDEFFNDKNNKIDGKYSICKSCKQKATYAWRSANPDKYNKYAGKWRKNNPDKQHATDVKRLYGLSIEDYNKMLTKQHCSCKICGKQHDPSVKRGRLYVDHCHKTGKIRGLLCNSCNAGIGYFEDSLERLQKAMDYLNKSP